MPKITVKTWRGIVTEVELSQDIINHFGEDNMTVMVEDNEEGLCETVDINIVTENQSQSG